jgi:hypothetical protein
VVVAQEVVQGQVVISSPKGFAHQGIAMKVEGSARLQLSTKSAGLFDSFYNSVAPLEVVYFHLPVAPPGKVPLGISKFPFEFALQGNDQQRLFETYHGVYISVTYEIVCDCVRGILKNNLHKTLEFIVEVPVRLVGSLSGCAGRVLPSSSRHAVVLCIGSCESLWTTRRRSSASPPTRSRTRTRYAADVPWA